jgi:hypothetical protein
MSPVFTLQMFLNKTVELFARDEFLMTALYARNKIQRWTCYE